MSNRFTPLLKSILSRLAQATLTLLGASLIIWSLLPLAPGDPAVRLLVARGYADPTEAQIVEMRREIGLDQPLHVQYLHWLGNVLQGDLSDSLETGRPVLVEFGQRVPATLTLAAVALAMALTVSIPAALISVIFKDRWPDDLIRLVTQFASTLPAFLIAVFLLQVVVMQMNVGRVISNGDIRYVWLPAICLANGRAADWTQLLRASLLETLSSRFILVARARGASRLRCLIQYALPNAILPLLTAIGMSVVGLLSGSAIIEGIFTWPGLGSFTITAISARDLTVIQGFMIVVTLVYVVSSFLVDAAAMLIDPRMRTGAAA